MKRGILGTLVLAVLLLGSCSEDATDELPSVAVTFDFSHHWDGQEVTGNDLNTVQFTNANGEQLSIELLRYLVSDITLENENGEVITLDDYNLVDLTRGTGLSYTTEEVIPIGTYTNVSFTFGFDNEDNEDGVYLDLNSASWNVPMVLGGGYHYMQLEGRFVSGNSVETGYQYHAIRAVDNSGTEQRFQDTFFTVDLGPITIAEGTQVEVGMNIAEWFKNPNQWDLNVLGSMLMPNFNAQVMISQNGQGVFALENVQ